MSLIDQFKRIIVLNELDGDLDYAYKFSDADGVRTGKSGWSFGVCQFDVANNSMAALCLKDCGFDLGEINSLRRQDALLDMKAMNAKLLAARDKVDVWDARQLQDCIDRAVNIATAGGFAYLDDKALLCAADYNNQFFISKGGQFFHWAAGLGHPVTDYDIYKFKMNLPWGQKRPDDVKRRYQNILKVVNGVV